MRLLLVNPNTSATVTRLIEQEARLSAHPDTQVTAFTAETGVPYIETETEAAVGACAVLEIIAREAPQHDAAIIAAFGDPGLLAAKSAVSIPVIGLSEAAFFMASVAAGTFGIVAISPRMQGWYRRAIEQQHMGPRFCGFRFLAPPLDDVATVQVDRADDLIALGASLVAQDGVGTVIYAGAPLAGFVRNNAHRIDFPALDGTAAAVHLAEAVAEMTQRGGRVAPPIRRAGKQAIGLSPAMARLF